MRLQIRFIPVLACLLAAFGQSSGQERKASSDVTAIDILLAPDEVMLDRAKVANDRLRQNYPKGFALDADHAPHVTVVQAFVKTADLKKVYAVVEKIANDEKPTTWELKATRYYDIPTGDLGLAGIVVEPNSDLIRLQKKLLDAIAPHVSDKATDAAFAPRSDGGPLLSGKPLIDYVTSFDPKASGKNYNPHVTIGLGNRKYLDQLNAEPFKTFTFKSRAVAVYQLGDFGTAQKLLWTSAPSDPLPSWNDGPAKQSILEFVAKTTKEGSPDFVPVAERVAVFDNDGTLWPENPLPFELAYTFDAAKLRLEKKPELKDSPAYKALVEHDVAKLVEDHHKLLMQLVVDTHAGMTTDEFHKSVADWFATAKHPKYKRLYSDLTYLPMQEVLKHLRANGYKTFIVSGGSADFMRVWAEKVYGIPPEQVVGTTFKTKYELKDDKPTLHVLPELALNDDKGGKPVGIHSFIGRRPVMCFGNSDGDHEMLQWTTVGRKPSFGLIVHHTDADREYAYDAKPKSSGKLIEALAAAPKRGWTVVDMKADWKAVFKPE